MSTPTTYVLIHGAWHDARAWHRVIPLLTAAGHRVFAPSLTGHGDKSHLLSPDVGLDTHVADVIGLLIAEDLTNVVLVGHSYAGMVISSVANQAPDRISQLVYVDGMVPTDGESAIDIMPAAQFVIDAVAKSESPWRIPPLPELPAPVGLFGLTDPDDISWLRTTLSDESVLCFQQRARMDNPASAAIPRAHIHCVGFEPEGFTRRPIPTIQPNGAPARVREVRSGHDCMLIVPNEFTQALLAIS